MGLGNRRYLHQRGQEQEDAGFSEDFTDTAPFALPEHCKPEMTKHIKAYILYFCIPLQAKCYSNYLSVNL